MEKHATCFLDERIDLALQRLHEQNGEYRSALEKGNVLYRELEQLLQPQEDTAELAQLREKLKAYGDQDFAVQAAVQEAVYKAGYQDCVKLLQLLGILPELRIRF